MKATIPRLELSMEHLQKILEHARSEPLSEAEYDQLKGVLETLGYVTQLLEDKDTTLGRLRKILFGPSTEKKREVMKELRKDQAQESATAVGTGETAAEPGEKPAKSEPESEEKIPGHGRNGAQAYGGAQRVTVPHRHLKKGDRCPECHKGKLYGLATPGVLVRITAQAPLMATVYDLEKLRCNLCGEVYTAEAPEGVGGEKYDANSISMMALLRYGSGVPFYRLERLQSNLEIPLPASTQWEMVAKGAEKAEPAYRELIYQAAQGEVLYNDDTSMTILDLKEQTSIPPPALPVEMGAVATPTETKEKEIAEEGPGPERTGVWTSGIVSTRQGKKIALFFSGRKHAGENLRDLLKKREAELGPPIQMCDGADRNVAKDLQVILGNCILHGRRQFVDVAANFPEECSYVLEIFSELYKNDAFCREHVMSPEEGLAYHQTHSGPLMKRLQEWMEKQFQEHLVEPNSGLGKAIRYMQKRWSRLTLFLRQAAAPLDNNIVERTLKRAILHRKNSLFFKNENGAAVGDLFMSLIRTCELNGVNAFDYLKELQWHAELVTARPRDWQPWNYRDTLHSLQQEAAADMVLTIDPVPTMVAGSR